MAEPVTRIASRAIVLDQSDIDTDQIIPARFLTTTGRAGLGRAAFHDWRFDATGARTAHPLNREDFAGRAILVAGRNFGCGSSREHAVWALRDFGVRAVIAPAIADIFAANALKNGLVPVVVDAASWAACAEWDGEIVVDLTAMTVGAGPHECGFALEPFARACLIAGTDSLGFLLNRLPDIIAFEERASA